MYSIFFSTTRNFHIQSHNLEQSEFWHQCGRLIYHSTIECVYKINIGLHCCVGITILAWWRSVLSECFSSLANKYVEIELSFYLYIQLHWVKLIWVNYCMLQIDEECNILMDGSLIDLCGAVLLWRSAEGMSKIPVRKILFLYRDTVFLLAQEKWFLVLVLYWNRNISTIRKWQWNWRGTYKL